MGMNPTLRRGAKGLRQFLDPEQQLHWLDGKASPQDADERTESLELRFRYAPRFQKLMGRPQAPDVLDLLRLYGRTCLPIPRRTERDYWSVSCLPSTSDKPLIRVNASWMELFTLYADGEGLRGRVIVHLSDFTTDRSPTQEHVDRAFLEHGVDAPEDVSCFFPNGADIFGVRVRGAASIRKFLTAPRVLRAIRSFNLTHMNRGRNAYQGSHCYGLADVMLEGED
jgi:hypothetical protein